VRVHVPKNGFLRRSLSTNLENYVSRKGNVLYAYVGNFWTITNVA
jgi:hypothetical protein